MPLQAQELAELRVAGLHLLASGVAAVGQVEAAAVADRQVVQAPEGRSGVPQPARRVNGVQVEDDAGVRLPGPGEEALAVALDQADRAVDWLDAVREEVAARVRHERGQRRAGDVEFGDHLGRRRGGPEAPVQCQVVAVDVVGELLGVRPVDLPGGRQVVGGVEVDGAALVRVREVEEFLPLLAREGALAGGDGRVVGDGAVAGEDAAPEEVAGLAVDRELAVAVEEARRDPRAEGRDQVVHLAHLDDALHLPPGRQPEPDRDDRPEEAVAADRQPEEVGLLPPGAAARTPVGVDQGEGRDVGNDRAQGQPAAVDVRGQRAAEAEAIGARLLLGDPPRPLAPALRGDQVRDQGGPLDAGLDLDLPALGIEVEHPVDRGHVEQHRPRPELLAAHCVPAAGDAHRAALPAGGEDGGRDLLDAGGPDDPMHPRGVESRVGVVDKRPAGRVVGGLRDTSVSRVHRSGPHGFTSRIFLSYGDGDGPAASRRALANKSAKAAPWIRW